MNAMFRVQTTINLGCEQFERVIEVDDIQTLTSEEREKLFDIATGPLTIEREEVDDEPEVIHPGLKAESMLSMLPQHGTLMVPEVQAYTSHTQNLVEHGLFEKDFYIKHTLDLLRILGDGEGNWTEHKLVLQSLMSYLGIKEEQCGENKPDHG